MESVECGGKGKWPFVSFLPLLFFSCVPRQKHKGGEQVSRAPPELVSLLVKVPLGLVE